MPPQVWGGGQYLAKARSGKLGPAVRIGGSWRAKGLESQGVLDARVGGEGPVNPDRLTASATTPRYDAQERGSAGDPALAQIFAHAYLPAIVTAATSVSFAAAWALLGRSIVGTPRMIAGCAWLAVFATVVMMVLYRGAPTRIPSIGAQVGAMVGSAAIFGSLQGTIEGLFALIAVAIFYLIGVVANVLRGESGRIRRHPLAE